MKMITERFKLAEIFPSKAAKIAQRLHIKKDEIPFVRKYYTAEKDKSEVNKKERAVVSYISTGIKDRDGEKLVPEGVLLDNYQKNPVVPFGHDYKSIPPAKNMWIKRDEKGLVAKTVFAKNQRAEEYYQAYTEDVGGTGPLLNAFSVGFIPLEWEDTDTKALEKNPDLPKRIYNKWELLEYSLVPIPSCAEALTIAVEKGMISKKLQKELEIEVVKDVPEKEFEVELETVTHPIGKEVVEKEVTFGEVEVEIEVDKVKGIKAGWVDEKEVEIEKDEPEYKPQIIYKDGMDFMPEDWCRDEDGAEWMWNGKDWIGQDGSVAKKEFSIKERILKHEIKDIITKPETTEKYHHIPVNPGCKITATITISAAKGIKATYCGESKKVHTYLFDVNKWTMADAKKWVEDQKGLKLTIEDIDAVHFGEAEIEKTEKQEETEEKEVSEETDSLRDPVSKERDEVKGGDREIQQSGGFLMKEEDRAEFEIAMKLNKAKEEDREDKELFTPKEFRMAIQILKESNARLLQEKDDHIADLKAGRVLSRKNRNIVKDAITALNAVLKADATGTQEDEDVEDKDDVTERTIQLEKDDDTKTFAAKDIEFLIEKLVDKKATAIIKNSFEKQSDPEVIKKRVMEAVSLEIDKRKGVVR